MIDRDKLDRTLRHVLGLLAQGEYEPLTASLEGPAADELRAWVEGYAPITLVMPPDEALRRVVVDETEDGETARKEHDAIRATGHLPLIYVGWIPTRGAWWCDVDLWSVEDGHSDLTLHLTLRERGGDRYEWTVEDLHVL